MVKKAPVRRSIELDEDLERKIKLISVQYESMSQKKFIETLLREIVEQKIQDTPEFQTILKDQK